MPVADSDASGSAMLAGGGRLRSECGAAEIGGEVDAGRDAKASAEAKLAKKLLGSDD